MFFDDFDTHAHRFLQFNSHRHKPGVIELALRERPGGPIITMQMHLAVSLKLEDEITESNRLARKSLERHREVKAAGD